MPPALSVSVVIPTFNRARYVGRAIRSVLANVVVGDEVIVVDDGSQDDTQTVLASFGDTIVVINGQHAGAGAARNLGIAAARNDLVAFLDSDDLWLQDKLLIQRQYMELRPEVLFCFTNFEVEDRVGALHPRYLARWQRRPSNWEEAFGHCAPYSSIASLPVGRADFSVYEGDLYLPQLTGFYILTDTLIARREAAGDALRFAEDLKTYEDLECFYSLAKRGRGAFLDIDLARQFDHADGRLSQLSFIEKLDARITLLRRHWGADEQFLDLHGPEYRLVLAELLCQRAGLLISHGQNREAARTLREVPSPPLSLRLLAHSPPAMTMAGLQLLRTVRRWTRPGSRVRRGLWTGSL